MASQVNLHVCEHQSLFKSWRNASRFLQARMPLNISGNQDSNYSVGILTPCASIQDGLSFDEAVFVHDVGCHKAECGMEGSAIEILHTRDWHTLHSAMRYNLARTYDCIACTPDDNVSDRRIPSLGVTAGVAGCNFEVVCEPNRVAHVVPQNGRCR